jgi:hypothetical protein
VDTLRQIRYEFGFSMSRCPLPKVLPCSARRIICKVLLYDANFVTNRLCAVGH